jgi:hypothetical protein
LIHTAEVAGTQFPAILVGCSPFFALDQFGPERARQYRERFLGKTDLIVDIVTEGLRCGAEGVQIIAPNAPFRKRIGKPPVLEALREVEKNMGSRIQCVATVFDEHGIDTISEFNNKVIMPDGAVTDRLRFDELLSLCDACKKHGAQFGLATHDPLSVIPKLRSSPELWRKTRLLACPINTRGYYMNGLVQGLASDQRDRALETLTKSGKPVLAIKALAAGRLNPRKGLSFAVGIPFVKAIGVGVGSVVEARETFSLLTESWALDDLN